MILIDPILELAELYRGEAQRCPACNFECCYPVSATIVKGDHQIEVHRRGISIEKAPDFRKRGVIIAIEFECESHHKFMLYYTFHKGTTYVTLKHIGDSTSLPVLWRD